MKTLMLILISGGLAWLVCQGTAVTWMLFALAAASVLAVAGMRHAGQAWLYCFPEPAGSAARPPACRRCPAASAT